MDDVTAVDEVPYMGVWVGVRLLTMFDVLFVAA